MLIGRDAELADCKYGEGKKSVLDLQLEGSIGKKAFVCQASSNLPETHRLLALCEWIFFLMKWNRV
jgi:hypothetical protein